MAILTTTAGKYLVFQNDSAWAIQADKPQSAPIGAKVRTVALPKGIVYGYDELIWLPGTPETYASQSSCRPATKVLPKNKYVAKWEQAMIDAEASRKAAAEAEPTVVLGKRGKVLAKAEPVIEQPTEITLTQYVAQADKMKMNELRAIGNTLGVKARSKAELAKKIWLVQHGQLQPTVTKAKAKKADKKLTMEDKLLSSPHEFRDTSESKPLLAVAPVTVIEYVSLVAMKMPALREVGKRYGVKARSKHELAERIIDAYHAQQAIKQVTVAVAA